MLLGALHLRTSKLFSLRAKRKFYNCSPFLGQNGRKTATTTAPPAKLAPTHAPARPSRALVAAWGRCAPILATPLLPQCHKQRPKRGVVTSADRGTDRGQPPSTESARMEPPADAEPQPDGSRIQRLPNGSSLRFTQRGDGSWRKPERIRGAATGAGGSGRSGSRSGRAGTGGRPRPASAGADGSRDAPQARDAGAPAGSAPPVPKVYDDLKDVLVGLSTREEREFLFKIERELTEFLAGEAPRFVFPPMNGHFRRLLHITCSRFGVDSSSSSQALWGLDKGMEVLRQPRSRVPVLRYTDLIPATCAPDRNVYSFPVDPPPIAILPEAAAAAAAAAVASRRQQMSQSSAAATAGQQRQPGSRPSAGGGGAGGSGARRGRGAFRFGLAMDEEDAGVSQPAAQGRAELPQMAANADGGANKEVAATSAPDAAGVAEKETVVGSAPAGQPTPPPPPPPAAAAAGGAAAARVVPLPAPGDAVDALAAVQQLAQQCSYWHSSSADPAAAAVAAAAGGVAAADASGVEKGTDHMDADPPPPPPPQATTDAASAAQHTEDEVEQRQEEEKEYDDEEEEEVAAAPSQPSQYGRYTAEVRQQNAQQWQRDSGQPERRTHATIGPSSTSTGGQGGWQGGGGGAASVTVASHSSWRLRRPGNGFVTLKAKGTDGISILFSSAMPQQQRGRQAGVTMEGECYYEVRLGQRPADGAAAGGGSVGYIAKHSTAGGMQILSNSGGSGSGGSGSGGSGSSAAAVIGERTAQGYTGVWVAVASDCWAVGLGSRLFEHEVMRAIDPEPPTFSDQLRYYVSFRSAQAEQQGYQQGGRLELRDIYAGKSLSQPSADVRHLLHVRRRSRLPSSTTTTTAADAAGDAVAAAPSLPQKRALAEMEAGDHHGGQAGGGGEADEPGLVAADGSVAAAVPSSESDIELLERVVVAVDQGASVRPLPVPSAAAVHRDDSASTMDGAVDEGRRRREQGEGQQQYLVVCSTASAASQLTEALSAAAAAATTAAGDRGGGVDTITSSSGGAGGAWEARSLLSLLAEGWGGAVGFEPPKVRQQTLCATGVNRLVGRALR
eukprot:COSAG06_NODE_244_length_19215_cov_20.256853_12_plen_1068_part_00